MNERVLNKVTYQILNAKKKTAAVVTADKKVTSVNVAKTVKINGVTYKVTRISKNAFKSCKKLKKVTIGSNVKKIEKNAFAGCSKLRFLPFNAASATFENEYWPGGGKAFSKIDAKAKVTVPAKKLSKYKKMLKKAGLPKKATVKK